ncbi:MAG: hypothetical protein ABI479_04005 [Gallionella sp.]
MMDSKSRLLIKAVILAAILWLLGGLVFNMAVGMVCVLIGVAIVGWAAGNIMDTPTPSSEKK